MALTPAEQQRLEKIKTVLGHLPEAQVARLIAGWVKSLPQEFEDGPAYERPVQRSENP